MSNVAVGCFSRNNSRMFKEFFIPKVIEKTPRGTTCFNIDDHSDMSEVSAGQAACVEHSTLPKANRIIFASNTTRGLQCSISKAIDLCNASKWLIVFQTDCYCFDDYLTEYINELNSGAYDQFGMVGINCAAEDIGGTHPDQVYDAIKRGDEPHLALARTPLATNPAVFWLRPQDIPMSELGYPTDVPFSVEIPCWMVTAVNIPLFQQYINTTNKFHMIYAWDDIAMQFLSNNVHNVAIPWIYAAHRPFAKTKYGLATHSSVEAWKMAQQGIEAGEKIIGNADHKKAWSSLWQGWSYEDKDSFQQYLNYCLLYSGPPKLMLAHRHHNLMHGPVKVF